VDRILAGDWPKGECPPLWDGHAAERVADALERWNERWNERGVEKPFVAAA